MSYRKLGRNSAARKALFTSILTSFFRYGRIETTEAKAKELRKFAENLITLAKRGDLSARRQAIAQLADEDVVRKLFDEIASKYADRQGGCHANADLFHGDIRKPYEVGCEIQKKRLECAILVQAVLALEKMEKEEQTTADGE